MTPRVLVTRDAAQSGALQDALRDAAIDPVVVPAIAVEFEPSGGPLGAAARALHAFDWVVITSVNGARALGAAAEPMPAAFEGPRWAAIGATTADALQRVGIEIAFRPSRADAATLAEELPIAAGETVLLARGDLADDALPRRLGERGARITEVIAYRTIEGPPSSRALLRAALAAGRPAAVLFASGSAVRGLTALARHEDLDVTAIPAICIGPETARQAMASGFAVAATAATPDPAALALATVAALAQPMETR